MKNVAAFALIAGLLVSGCAYTAPLIPPTERTFKVEIGGNTWVQWTGNLTTEKGSKDISGTGEATFDVGPAKQLGVTIKMVNNRSQYGTEGVMWFTATGGSTRMYQSFLDKANGTEKVVVIAY